LPKIIRVGRGAGLKFARDGSSFLAQALAFNALFALIPLVLLAISLLGFIYGDSEGQRRFLLLVRDLAPALSSTVSDNFQNVVKLRNISGIVGFVSLIWSGKNLFSALAYALDRALGIPAARPYLHDLFRSIVMLPVAGIFLIGATALPLVISFIVRFTTLPNLRGFSEVGGYTLAVVLVFIVTAILYAVLPNRRADLHFAIPGAVVAAVLFEIVQIAFAVYTTSTSVLHIYGVASAILALLLWIYLMGAIFLYGAQFCAEWEADELRGLLAAEGATGASVTAISEAIRFRA